MKQYSSILTIALWLAVFVGCSGDDESAASGSVSAVDASSARPPADPVDAGGSAATDSSEEPNAPAQPVAGRGEAGGGAATAAPPPAADGGAAGTAGASADASIGEDDDASVSVADAGPGRYDYVNDIAPLLTRYCTGCHGPSEIGPFHLDSYEQAKAYASQAAGAASARIMPPCASMQPRTCGPSDAEIAILVEWAAGTRPLDLSEP